MIPHALLPQFAGLAAGMLAAMLAQPGNPPPPPPPIPPEEQPAACFTLYRNCVNQCLELLPDGVVYAPPAPPVVTPDESESRAGCFEACQLDLGSCLQNMTPGSFPAVGSPCVKQYWRDLILCRRAFAPGVPATLPPNPAKRQARRACESAARLKLARCLQEHPRTPFDLHMSIIPPPDHVAIDQQAMDVQFTVEGADELTRMQWWAIPDAPEAAPGEGGEAPPPPEPVMLVELFVLSVGPLPLSVPLTALPAGSPAFILAAVLLDDTGEVIVDPAGQPLLFTHEVTRGTPPAP